MSEHRATIAWRRTSESFDYEAYNRDHEWTFEGGSPASAVTSGNRSTATFTGNGSRVITVRVIQSSGPSGDGTTVITVGTGTGGGVRKQ